MIQTKIFNLSKSGNLTKKDIINFFEQKKIKPVKWAVVKTFENSIKIFASFEGDL